jgi:type I restriction enzyme, S subunit
MSTTKYPSYKDVPIPWVASIPEHWDWMPVLGVASERDEDNKGMKENNLLSLSYGNIVNKDINTSDGLLPESFETYQIVRPGDIVLRLTDLQNDKRSLRSALVTQAGIITSAYLALKPESIDPKYLGYLLRAYDVSKVFYSMGGGLRQSMKYGDIKRMPLVIPTKAEQLAIAIFLDRETGKIDALITEQQRLIELLQEKRQAVISHAVTKGLNPNAPMKDSGVEWLGEVPEHWEVGPIKRFFTSMNYKRIPLSAEERATRQGEYPYYGASGIIDSVDEFLFDEPLVLVSEDGANLLMRSSSIAFVASGKYWVNNHAHIIRPNDGMPTFWSERIESLQIAPFVTGSAQPKLPAEALMNLTVAAPPGEAEKDAIEKQIQEARAEFDPLLDASRNAITLLQERRSALISAAVTGQIDVRGLVEAEVGEQ